MLLSRRSVFDQPKHIQSWPASTSVGAARDSLVGVTTRLLAPKVHVTPLQLSTIAKMEEFLKRGAERR